MDNVKVNNIVKDIKTEMKIQESKFGEQNYPILDKQLIGRGSLRMSENYEIPSEDRARQLVEIHAKRNELTWMHILIEEIAEIASCETSEYLYEEIIQSAAVLVQMALSVRKNGV